MSRFPGHIIKLPANTPSQSSAPGVWTLKDQLVAQRNNQWPFQRDPDFRYTTLLLQGNVPNTTGPQAMNLPLAYNSDASSNNFLITPNGDVSPRPFSPYGGGNYSLYTDSTSNYLQIPSNPALALGASDFCIEYWVYPTSTTNRVISWAAANCPIVYMESDQTLQFANYGVGSILQSVAKIPLNQWTHCAVSRASGVNRMFINGALVATTTNNQTWGQANLNIGVDISSNAANGYISNLRVVKGSPVYTAAFTPPTEALQNIPNTILLTCQSNRFIDNSTANGGTGFAITRVGTPRITDNSPFVSADFTTGSGYFDGTGDYLSAADSEAFNFGNGDFTVEMWTYLTGTSSASAYRMTGQCSSAVFDSDLSFAMMKEDVTDKYLSYVRSGSTNYETRSSLSRISNAWVHIALVRSGGNLNQYINGQLDGQSTALSTNTINNSTKQLSIGRQGELDAGYFLGNITSYRIVKGVAVYTGNFTPPSLAPLARSGAASAASYPSTTNVNTSFAESATSLLTLQTRAPSQNHGFIDSSPNEFIVTRNGNVSQGTFSPFSPTGWGYYLAEQQNNTVNFTTSAGTDFQFSGDFTIEGWVYPQNSSGDGSLFVVSDNTNYLALNISISANVFNIYLNGGTPAAVITSDIPVAAWTHVAMVRNGSGTGNIKLYVNGGLKGSATSTSTLGFANPAVCRIGGGVSGINRYYSNVRVCKSAVYTAAFTPITLPLSTTSQGATNCVLLTANANRFLNQTAGAAATITGSPSVQAFSPFAPANSVSPLVTGGSGYFPGSTSVWLVAPDNPALELGSNDFTIECWVYSTADFSANRIFTSKWNHFVFGINSTPALSFTWYGTTNGSATGTLISTAPNAWHHFAVCRQGGTLYMFQNGQKLTQSNSTITGTLNNDSYGPMLGGNENVVSGAIASANEPWYGYISGYRMVNGTALYTSSFPIPTAPPTAIPGTSLLLNFTGGGIVDATGKNVIETVNHAQIARTQAKWDFQRGGSSLIFDGTTDRHIVPKVNWRPFGTGNFTIECWFRVAAISGVRAIISQDWLRGISGPTFSLFIGEPSSDRLTYFANGGSVSIIAGAGSAIVSDTWYHLAVVRNSGTTTMYLNGLVIGTPAADTYNYPSGTNNIYIGGSDVGGSLSADFNGFINDLRVTAGVARYTGSSTSTPNFTLPNGPFPIG